MIDPQISQILQILKSKYRLYFKSNLNLLFHKTFMKLETCLFFENQKCYASAFPASSKNKGRN